MQFKKKRIHLRKGTSKISIEGVIANIVLPSIYALLFLELFSFFYHDGRLQTITLALLCFFFFLTIINPFWALFIFLGAVPLLSGLHIAGVQEILFFGFTGIYMAWLPLRLIKGKKIVSPELPSFFIDLLCGIILLNVLYLGLCITELPEISKNWLNWFVCFPVINQQDTLWPITAGIIILKGLSLFRIIALEIDGEVKQQQLKKVLYVQAVVIIAFSLWQLIKNIIHPEQATSYFLRLNWPFYDIHSYGSCVVFFFVLFALMAIQAKKTQNVLPPDNNDSPPSRGNNRVFTGSCTLINTTLAAIFLLLCLASHSRMTLLVLILFSLGLSTMLINSRKALIVLTIVTVITGSLGIMVAPRLVDSKNYSLHRLGTLLDIRSLPEQRNTYYRFELWKRAATIIKAYPLAGAGTGTFYRTSRDFSNKPELLGGLPMNTHNYYLQFTAENGIPALILFCLVLFTIFRKSGLREALRSGLSKNPSLPLIGGAIAYMLTMMTGHPLLLLNQQFMFWGIIAIIATTKKVDDSCKNSTIENSSPSGKAIGLLLFGLFFIGFSWRIANNDHKTIMRGYGLYAQENWNGRTMQWMAGKACFYLQPEEKRLAFTAIAQPFNIIGSTGLNLTVAVNDQIIDTVRFNAPEGSLFSHRLTGNNDKPYKVVLELDQTFSPYHIGLNNDTRVLGVALDLNPDSNIGVTSALKLLLKSNHSSKQ